MKIHANVFHGAVVALLILNLSVPSLFAGIFLESEYGLKSAPELNRKSDNNL